MTKNYMQLLIGILTFNEYTCIYMYIYLHIISMSPYILDNLGVKVQQL